MGEEAVPGDKKKAASARGLVLFLDEASFWLDGTLHQTWSRIGEQPRVDTYGQRKTAHVYGALGLADARFQYRFADVFNGKTFFVFLRQLVATSRGRKLFIIIDNGPCHDLGDDGAAWLRRNKRRIELFRLPTYSPEFNAIEGAWKATRKFTTHNKFYPTTIARDSALRRTFATFRRRPALLDGLVRRWRQHAPTRCWASHLLARGR